MKRSHRLLLALLTAALAAFPKGLHAQHPIGFIEKFALAPDRAAALKELIPGTEEYYFYHALHLQNSGRHGELDALIAQWAKRTPDSTLLREIRHREALLKYDTSPQATLDYLKDVLKVSFDHQQDTLHPKPNLPTALDQALIGSDKYVQRALEVDATGASSFLTDRGVESMIASDVAVSPQHRRSILHRVQRPDLPHLVDWILADFNTEGSRGFGEHPIHEMLLQDQLQVLANARPELMKADNFVRAMLSRLRPGNDTDLDRDPKAREAWLVTAWNFVKKLPPSFNALKVHLLYQRLVYDEKTGAMNEQRFMEYVKMPRAGSYVTDRIINGSNETGRAASLNEDFTAVTSFPQVGNDEALVHRYLLHFLKDAPSLLPYAPYIELTFLQRNYAEAKLLAGVGDAEALLALLSPEQVQSLRDRVDIDFDPTTPDTFASAGAVELDLHVKHVPHLTVNIYEINTQNYYQNHGEQIGTDLNLDGLIANHQESFDYTEQPILRVKRHLKLSSIPARRGVWVVDFVGNGTSSRALIRKGQLHIISRPSSAGTVLVLLDEKGEVVTKGYAELGGRRYRADQHGEIHLPFSNQPKSQPVLLGDGEGFAQTQSIYTQGEQYSLYAGFHVPRESLLSGSKATIAIRPSVLANGAPASLTLLEDRKLTVTSMNADNVSSSIVKQDLNFAADRETTVTIDVPERLVSLSLRLEGRVKSMLTGERTPVVAERTFAMNELDKTEATADVFLSKVGGAYLVQELGRSGEPRSDRAISLRLWRPEFVNPMECELKTDANGAVALGALEGVSEVEARNASGQARQWTLPRDRGTCPSKIQIAAGQKVFLPWMDEEAKLTPPLLSLLELRQGHFVRSLADAQHVILQDGNLEISQLDPGDYSLRYGKERREVSISVTRGPQVAGWVVGATRDLQISRPMPLQISSVTVAQDVVTIGLGNATPDTRVHVLASRFVPPSDVFSALGQTPGLEPMTGVPATLESAFVSGRMVGDEYRYVMERRNMKKFPGVMLPRPGLLLNPWQIRETATAAEEAQSGGAFQRLSEGRPGALSPPAPAAMPADPFGKPQMSSGTTPLLTVADVDFLATTGFNAWNLKPNQEGRITLKLSDLGDRPFVRVLAVNAENGVVRDVSLADKPTKTRNLALRNGLDPQGHFTRQNQITLLEKDAPLTLKDGTTAQYEAQGDLRQVFDLFRTLSNSPTLPQFSFLLDWPKFDDAKKRQLYSEHACHEMNFFLQRKDPAFFKALILPYLANKRDRTFMDHYLLGDDLHAYLRPWAYQRLNVVERILLAQRHPEERPVVSRETNEMNALLPPNIEQQIHLFETALGIGNLEGGKRPVLIAKPSGADPFAPPGGGNRSGSMAIAPDSIDGLIQGTARPMGATTNFGLVTNSVVNEPMSINDPIVPGRYYTEKMQRVIFPSVQFQGASIEEAIEFLRVKSKDLDTFEHNPAQKGVNIILRQSPTPSNAQISLDLHDVPMVEALRYITELAGMKYKVEPYAVVVVPITEVGSEMFTRTFKVPRNFLTSMSDFAAAGAPAAPPDPFAPAPGTVPSATTIPARPTAITILQAAGITLPEGASATYDPVTSQIVVRNTQPNLDNVEALVDNLMAKHRGVGLAVDGDGFANTEQLVARDAALRAVPSAEFYRKLESTKEWVENNYYRLPIEQQLADLVTINGFWKDYAAWDGKGAFLSTHVAEASHNFAEMMLALSVLDLPFPADAKAPKVEVKDLTITITPAQRLILFHRELKPAEIDKDAPRLLVSQNFYRNGDRYIEKDGEKLDKFVTEEFLTGVVYGCQVVVTNPTSSTQKLDLLLQIPQGAIPVLGSKSTDNRPLTLESYRTFTSDYYFYFPKAGTFAHHPVHVSKAEKVVAFAPLFTFNVVNELTKLDTQSWDYVSQFGKPEDVLGFLGSHNLHQLDLERMAWRLRDAGFYKQAIALLGKHHVYDSTLWSYSILNHDADGLREYLQHEDEFINECGPALASKLINIDPVSRYSYQHLEYSPLVNARTHQVGAVRMLLNDRLTAQYESLLSVLAHRASLDDEDRLAVSYYLFLQDRIEEALADFASVDVTKVSEKLQYDYMKAVAALYQGDTATARQIAQNHAANLVDRWKDKFTEVLAQLDEIEGKKPEKIKEDDREQRQNKLATSEPTLDFKVENHEVKLTYHNIPEVTVNYYPMDLEFLFSSAPFVGQNTSRFGLIRPNKTEHMRLPADKEAHLFALPKEFHSSNVLVEIVSGAKVTAHAYYANELNVQISENYGRLQVLHAGDNRPLARTYVKVFAEIGGQAKFFKDGYTDLRGKFDYLSLSTGEMDQATRFSILILSDEFGAAVREVKPPKQ